jgi:type I restriction enzyme, S subunit
MRERIPIAVTLPEAADVDGWQWSKLSDLARLESGHTPSRSRSAWWGGEISWLSLTEIRAFDGQWVDETRLKTNEAGIANSSARILPKGTVCLSRTASVGFVAILARPMATSQDFANWVCGSDLDPDFLMYALIRSRGYLRGIASGATHKTIYMPALENFHLFHPALPQQRQIAERLRAQLSQVAVAQQAAETQWREVSNLANRIVVSSVCETPAEARALGTALDEVKEGIGDRWSEYPTLGATRHGLALAKEKPGRQALKYKPAFQRTVFYNPMRILIGSIAFVDDDDEPGITSPDYVVLKGKPGVVDSRWFYYWLRSPLGERCIRLLARGAVRERMLFNRLAEGEIELPEYDAQVRASEALAQIKPMRAAIIKQVKELQLMPQKILARAFDF